MKKTRTSSRSTSRSKTSPQTKASHRAKPKRSFVPFIIAGAVILLLIAAGLIFYFMRGNVKDVVVRVNSNPITQEQLDFQYNLLPQSYRDVFTQEQVLEQIIDEELIVQTARRQGVNASPEDVNERVQQIMAQNELTPADLQTNLADLNVTLEQFEQLIARQIIIERYLKDAIKPAEVDNTTLRQLYNESLDKYAVGEQATVRHVLVSNQRPDAALEAKRIYDEARNGTDFCDLVKNASDDRGSRNTCGQYTFPRGFMVPEFEAASFEMKNGEIRLVQTQFGYHIILKLNSTPAGYKPFSEVHDELRSEYESSQRSGQYRQIVATLRERATISYANGTTIMPQRQQPTVSAPEAPEPPIDGVPSEPQNATENATVENAPQENVTVNVTAPSAENVTANLTAPVEQNATQNITNTTAPVEQNVAENATTQTVTAPQNVTVNITAPVENKTVEQPPVEPQEPVAPEQPQTPPVNATPDTTGLLSCIASKTTLYGTTWSTDTQDARSLFARNNVPLKYVACDEYRPACKDIIAFPTWDIDGQRYLGRLTLTQLRNAADC